MAILNVKNFPDELHARLQERARSQHRSVAQEVIHLLRRGLEEDEPLSLLELRGLAKEAWAGAPVTEHVARERDAWD